MLPSIPRLTLACAALLLLSSCTAASLRDSWHSSADKRKGKYQKILVASLLSRDEDRRNCEETIALRLQRRGIVAYTGYEMFPVSGRPSWQFLADAVDLSGADCVVTVQAVPQEFSQEEENVAWLRRITLYPEYWLPEMFPQWNLYSHYRYTRFYEPHPVGTPQLFVQVNLFDAATKRLVWAGKIESSSWENMPTDNAAVASLLVESLVEADLI